MGEQVIITALITLLGMVITSSIVSEIYKRRIKKLELREEDERETSKEKIIDTRLLANELMTRVRELEGLERNLINEKIALLRAIDRLEREVEGARRFHVEQDEEITLKQAEIDRLNREIIHLQSVLTSIAKGEDIKVLIERAKRDSKEA